MDVTRTAFGTWSGGRYLHFGEPLPEERFLNLIRAAYDQGIRSFLTADVYGNGEADEMLGRALSGVPRDSYCLIGAIGHDFYSGRREGAKGYPRFTDPQLRAPSEYRDYLRMATERSLERCRASKFDLLLLHNPDSIGYFSDAVWSGLESARENGLADRLGVAPGPANGFTLDLLRCFERFGALIDWAMIILNPLEPWPGSLCLSAAQERDVRIITRVADYGGLFHDDIRPGHRFAPHDHRTFRPAGWVEAGLKKIDAMRPTAQSHRLTLLQFACAWNLSQPAVQSVVPTLIQEIGGPKPIEVKLAELAALPQIQLSTEETRAISEIGDNKGCMALKGASPDYSGAALADRWPLDADLEAAGRRWGIDPQRDLACTHASH